MFKRLQITLYINPVSIVICLLLTISRTIAVFFFHKTIFRTIAVFFFHNTIFRTIAVFFFHNTILRTIAVFFFHNTIFRTIAVFLFCNTIFRTIAVFFFHNTICLIKNAGIENHDVIAQICVNINIAFTVIIFNPVNRSVAIHAFKFRKL